MASRKALSLALSSSLWLMLKWPSLAVSSVELAAEGDISEPLSSMMSSSFSLLLNPCSSSQYRDVEGEAASSIGVFIFLTLLMVFSAKVGIIYRPTKKNGGKMLAGGRKAFFWSCGTEKEGGERASGFGFPHQSATKELVSTFQFLHNEVIVVVFPFQDLVSHIIRQLVEAHTCGKLIPLLSLEPVTQVVSEPYAPTCISIRHCSHLIGVRPS
jgi:hypothetical protein